LHHLLPTTLASFSSLFVPKSGGSSNANEIDSLYKITLYIALVIFVSVEGALGYALWKFRKRKGAVAAQIHGNTRLEIGWTLGAALILVVLSVVTFVKLSSIQDPPNSDPGGDVLAAESGELYATADKHLPPNGKSLEIQVIGRQFIWQYVYPGATNHDGLGAPYAYTEMVVPTKTTVTLDIVSSDVVHSWWIPALGGKFQAVPGYHNYSWFKINKPGTYRGQCANLCGRGHARMIAIVHAEEPAEFDFWLANQKRMLEEANAEAAKERAKLNSQNGPAGIENP
jgi:cytochrome c oxidase subunit 2